MGWLERYTWPGNVGELEEVIEQAVARCQGRTVTAQDLPQSLREPSRVPVSSGEAIKLASGGIAWRMWKSNSSSRPSRRRTRTSRMPPNCWGSAAPNCAHA